MKQIVLIAFTLLFARTTQSALPRDKFLTKEGKLSATLTLKDGQGGFVGITGLIWTVRPDGSWDRKRFINRTMRKADQEGTLTAKQLQSLADVLAHAQIHKLPAKLGKLRGANPHVVTLTWGKRKCVWTLTPGSPVPKYPDQPFGKLTPEDSFAEISQTLRSMLKTSKDK
jgi:hypothetical protein